jgi:hypothetical protein
MNMTFPPHTLDFSYNEMADQLARQGSSRPFIGLEPFLGVSAKIAREVIRRWTNRKHTEYWQSIHGQRQARGFLKRPSAKRAGELLSLSRNKLRLLTGLFTGHCHLKGHLQLVDSPKCDRCKQASETASHVLCNWKAMVALRFRYLAHYFMKPGD